LAISTPVRKAGPYFGNDATTVFPFAFKVFAAGDLLVVFTNQLGVESDLVLNTDYTVTLNSNQDVDPGGSVTLTAPLAVGRRLTITSGLEALQPLVLTNNGGFYPRVINDAFDRITMIAQQLVEQLGRSLKLPISSTASATLPDPVPNSLIAWDSLGAGFTNVPPGDLISVAGYADARIETFDGDGVETEFEIDFHPGVMANLDVSINGVTQVGGEDFTWLGTTVLFTSPPPAGTRILVRYARPLSPLPDFDSILTSVEDAEAAAAAAEAAAVAGDRVPYVALAASGGPGLVGWLSLGVGGVLRTLLAKVRETPLSPEDFGAVGNGTTDDSDAIEKALNAATLINGRMVGKVDASYRVPSLKTITRAATSKRLEIDWNGAELFLDEGALYIVGPPPYLTTTLAADAALGDLKLTLASTAGAAVGDLIVAESPAYSLATQPTKHVYVIRKVGTGGELFIDGCVVADITEQQVIDSLGVTAPIAVSLRKLVPGLTMKNGRVRHVDATGAVIGVMFEGQLNPYRERMIHTGNTRVQMNVRFGTGDLEVGCEYRDFGYVDAVSPPDGLRYGYGLLHEWNFKSTVIGSSGSNGWHVFDASGGQMHIDYIGCRSFNCSFGFSSHESAWHINYYDCENIGQVGWEATRGVYLTMVNCRNRKTAGTSGIAIGLSQSVQTVEIRGGSYELSGGATVTDSALISVSLVTAGPGLISAGLTKTWTTQGVTFKGRGVVSFGAPNSHTYMKNDRFIGETFVAEVAGTKVELDDEDYATPAEACVYFPAGADVLATNCRAQLPATTFSGSSMFSVVGVPTRLRFHNCDSSGLPTLVRCLEATAPVVVDEIIGGKFGFGVNGGSNVTAKNIMNTVRTADLVVNGAVLTTGANNNVLTT